MSLKSKAFDHSQNFIIALDGPAAAGKSTIGKMLANKFSLKYFQSSIVYRQLAYNCIEQKIDLKDITLIIDSLKFLKVNSELDLENEEIGGIASKIAIIPEVRSNINKHLISIINSAQRIIMEGRDIGTVVAPKADLKIFITASAKVRAIRRYNQLQKKGKDCILEEILKQIETRDKRDQDRKVSPLLPAKDALLIDTASFTPLEIINKITQFIVN